MLSLCFALDFARHARVMKHVTSEHLRNLLARLHAELSRLLATDQVAASRPSALPRCNGLNQPKRGAKQQNSRASTTTSARNPFAYQPPSAVSSTA